MIGSSNEGLVKIDVRRRSDAGRDNLAGGWQSIVRSNVRRRTIGARDGQAGRERARHRPSSGAPQRGDDAQIHPPRGRDGEGRRRDCRRDSGGLSDGGEGTHMRLTDAAIARLRPRAREYTGDDGVLRSIRRAWTSVACEDPIVRVGSGRSAFRVSDLLALASPCGCRRIRGPLSGIASGIVPHDEGILACISHRGRDGKAFGCLRGLGSSAPVSAGDSAGVDEADRELTVPYRANPPTAAVRLRSVRSPSPGRRAAPLPPRR